MKKIIKDYFTFTAKDRIAVFVILFLLVAFTVLPKFYGVKQLPQKADSTIVHQIAELTTNSNKENKKEYSNADNGYNNSSKYNTNEPIKGTLFLFDPNTISEEGWLKLGLRAKTIQTIINYRSKGGKFKNAEDIRKIWGLRKDEADRLIPYIKIADTRVASGGKPYNNNSTNTYNKPLVVDINLATPYDFKALPNIGTSLPYKIVNYREKLGGFISVQQIKETYGMVDSIYNAILPYLQIKTIELRKININTATDYDLSVHPYIDKSIAKAIVIYRTKYGGYSTVADIKKIVFITNEVFNKIAPYLSVE
ncbi:MAG: helix-hairpin-helix domain-containing protein [Chitinophagaceae bacterium]|jgi:competence protein ComEA|nr:helix-hairpin-helix domain-containing protein [Chitinophagaceae bacterium]MBP9739223.1 helix-hairpin-helix domain-containing protein [Chitinophagaceae bacterium]